MRFLLAETLTDQAAGFDHINQVVPQVGLHQLALALVPGGGRLIKTHELYRKEYARAIYLVRDVRDAMLSLYDRGKSVGVFNGMALDIFVPLFLKGEINTIGPWASHVRAWLDSPLAARGDLLLVRFEDMRRDTVATLTRVLEFLGVSVEERKIRNAVAANSVDRMRAKEDASRFLPQSPEESGRFVRSASVGGWRSRLTEEQAKLVDHYAAAELKRLGYALSEPSGPWSANQPPAWQKT